MPFFLHFEKEAEPMPSSGPHPALPKAKRAEKETQQRENGEAQLKTKNKTQKQHCSKFGRNRAYLGVVL